MIQCIHFNNYKGGKCKGIILDLGGKVETTYAWGLGNSTNNQIDAYVIFQGLCIAIKFIIKYLIVIGD